MGDELSASPSKRQKCDGDPGLIENLVNTPNAIENRASADRTEICSENQATDCEDCKDVSSGKEATDRDDCKQICSENQATDSEDRTEICSENQASDSDDRTEICSENQASDETCPEDQATEQVASIADRFLQLELTLCDKLQTQTLPDSVTLVYNPLEYARAPHMQYLHKYCTSTKEVLFLGMNPGPYGMTQTGVPFGEVNCVREWLEISDEVTVPKEQHPKRPILGFSCTRSEVSGRRFWSFVKEVCGTPEQFFKKCFVHNVCPLLYLGKSGKNLTPVDFPAATRKCLEAMCRESLIEALRLLEVKTIVGVGKFASSLAVKALKDAKIDNVKVETLMHPSPANPQANKEWSKIARNSLTDMDVLKHLTHYL